MTERGWDCFAGAVFAAFSSLAVWAFLVAVLALSGCACGHRADALILAEHAAVLAEVSVTVQVRPLTSGELRELRDREVDLRAHALLLGESAEAE